ncbi:MAG TPA: hypothetical protein VGG25_11565 [Streptosporangiaceae bacterium]|jgi:hypothetical protein
MTSLSQVLAECFQPRPVLPEVRARRERLCAFARRHEARLFDVTHPRAAEVRALLGWDDETMAAFIDSPLLCHSSPHASMNSFPPMMAFPWIFARAIDQAQRQHGVPAVHVRNQCTHHDFNDTFSKPHAWWHRGPGGEVVKTKVFTRLPIKYHPMLSKAAPRLSGEPMRDTDSAAIALAELGTNYASYCVIYRMYLERLAGFHMDNRVIEFPIDLLNRFTIGEIGMLPWFALMDGAALALRQELDNAPMERLSEDGARELDRYLREQRDSGQDSPWLERAVIAPNMINFSQFYLLGLSLMLGGRAMAGYVPEMNATIEKLTSGIEGWQSEPPAFLPVTTVPVAELLGLGEEAARSQAEYGISTTLSLVASARGAGAGPGLDPLLAGDYRDLYPDSAT